MRVAGNADPLDRTLAWRVPADPGGQMDENRSQAQVLVVEDDPEIAFLLDFMLRRDGYAVSVLGDGRAALARIGDGPVADLVVLDAMLPFADGIQILTALRAAAAWAAVPVIMLTAKSRERDIVLALDAGANDYLVKPFQPAELGARVRRLLPRRA